jgi:hypothetical protein
LSPTLEGKTKPEFLNIKFLLTLEAFVLRDLSKLDISLPRSLHPPEDLSPLSLKHLHSERRKNKFESSITLRYST